VGRRPRLHDDGLVLTFIDRSRLSYGARACSAVAGAILALAVLAGSVSAVAQVDMRGLWACVASVGSTRYPQTIDITSEDFTTGQIAGTDVGGGMTFTVSGTVVGNRFTMVISNTGYSSTALGTVGGVIPNLSFTGSFSDSNHSGGPFTGSMTASAALPGPTGAAASAPSETPSSAASAGPGATNGIAFLAPGASAGLGNGGPASSAATAPPSDPNPLPLPLELALAALIAGLGAAALGLIPGVPGIGGSSGAAPGPHEVQALDEIAQSSEFSAAPGTYMHVPDAISNDPSRPHVEHPQNDPSTPVSKPAPDPAGGGQDGPARPGQHLPGDGPPDLQLVADLGPDQVGNPGSGG
jgi:hypothetical protein